MDGGLFSPQRQPPRGAPGSGGGAALGAVGPVVEEIEKIRRAREARRRSAQFRKAEDATGVAPGGGSGGGGGGGAGGGGGPRMDRDTMEFVRMIRAFREENARQAQAYAPPGEHSIAVIVRKRPINARETAAGDYDAVTCLNPRAIVHAPKKKVDAITRYLENTAFQFDYTFDELCDTPAVYRSTVQPLVDFAFRRGRGTCFAYGQTGSGKTHTMSGIQELVAGDVFERLAAPEHRGRLELHASFFEIYGGRAFDVLHARNPVIIREDERHRVVASGLQEVVCHTCAQLQAVIAQGNASRTTHSTEVNSQSSRSHAICELSLRYTPAGAAAAAAAGEGGGRGAQRPVPGGVHGSLTLIDLAGSERAADSRNHAQARRIESAEINKSLLALKECIRALAVRAGSSEDAHVHVPFRASKLTLALRDSFEAENSRVVMIATVSPCASSWDHTGNTLRYADRVKEQPGAMEFDGEGRVVAGGGGGAGGAGSGGGGGGGGRGANSCAVAKSYSFSAADAIGSGLEVDGLRVSPVTVEGEEGGRAAQGGGAGGAPGIITGAKAPPIAAFNRDRIASARAGAAREREGSSGGGGGSTEAAAPPPAVYSSSSSGSGGGGSSSSAAADAAPPAAPRSASAAPSSRGSLLSPPLRVPVQQQQQQGRPASQQSALRPPTSKPPPYGSSGSGVALSLAAAAAAEEEPFEPAAAAAAVDAGAAPSGAPAVGIARLMQRGAIGKGAAAAPLPAQAAAAEPGGGGGGGGAAAPAAPTGSAAISKDVKAKFSSKGKAPTAVPAASSSGSGASSSGSSGGGGSSAAAQAARAPPRRDENEEPSGALAPPPRAAAAAAAAKAAPQQQHHLPPPPAALPSSPQQKDIRALHESMRRGGDMAAGGEELLALHEAVGMIVDLEQDLMDAHLKAIQENAELLTEEGMLLAGLQTASSGADEGEGDYDMRSYAEKLEALLRKKHRTTVLLLEQIDKFRASLAHEEMLSTQTSIRQ